jgi:hypothetical protein
MIFCIPINLNVIKYLITINVTFLKALEFPFSVELLAEQNFPWSIEPDDASDLKKIIQARDQLLRASQNCNLKRFRAVSLTSVNVCACQVILQ